MRLSVFLRYKGVSAAAQLVCFFEGGKTMRIFKVSNLSHAFGGQKHFQQRELMVTTATVSVLSGRTAAGNRLSENTHRRDSADEWTFESNGKLRVGYLDQYADIDKSCTLTNI